MVDYIIKDENSIADNASRTLKALRLFRCFMTDPKKGEYMKHRGTYLLYGTNENEKIEEKIKVNGVYYFSIGINGKYNIIKENYEFLSKTWFESISSFAYNFSKYTIRVYLNKKLNFIDYNGNLLYKKPISFWFDASCNTFTYGTCGVARNKKCNYINLDGNLISKRWFCRCHPFSYGLGYGIVKIKNKMAVIKKDGTYLYKDLLFDAIIPIKLKNKKTLFGVRLNGIQKYIDNKGNFLTEKEVAEL